MPRHLSIPLALLALAFTASAATADWPTGPGVGFPLQIGPGNSSAPVVIPDGLGGAFFAWSDDHSGNFDVFAQRVSAAGVTVWGPITIAGGAGNQGNVVGLDDGAGGVVMCFSDDAAGLGLDLRLARINSSGTLVWPPSTMAGMGGAGNQSPMAMAKLSNGAIGLSISNDAAGNRDVWGSIINPAGNFYFNPVAICSAAGDQYGGPVVPDAAGGAYFVWDDFRPVTGNNIYSQRMNASCVPQWAANGLQISTTGYGNNGFTAGPDASGNLLVLWNDFDGAHRQILMSNRDPNGSDQGLGTLALTQGANDNYVGPVLPDGQGGLFVSYYSLYGGGASVVALGRFSAGGLPYWPAMSFSTNTQASGFPTIAADGDGGVFIGWSEYRNAVGWSDSYIQQASSDGGYVGSYTPTTLCNGINQDATPVLASDGRGGAIAAWQDARLYWSGNYYDLYAARIAPFAKLGNPEPSLAGVKDVPNDQGGHVTVRWNKSYLDKATNQQVNSYWVWRQLPAAAAQAALAHGARLFQEPPSRGPGAHGAATSAALDAPGGDADAVPVPDTPRRGERLIKRASVAAGSGYWEYVGQQYAQGFPSYSFEIATGGDSVAASNPRTLVMVEAYAYSGHWESLADSGYSVDNLPPATPAPFVGQYDLGITRLHWDPNTEADLAGYRLYRGNSPTFLPDASNLVASLPDTGTTTSPGHYVYKLTAVDSHGNESVPAVLVPSGPLDAPGVGVVALSLSRPWPNPARGLVTLRFALPAETRVRLAILDAQGRVVRVLAEGERQAGEQTLTWDQLDERGARAPAGLYFVRLRVGSRVMTERFVALH